MQFTFKTYTTNGGWLATMLIVLLNRWQIYKAKRIADQYCASTRKKYYILPVADEIVVASTGDLALINSQLNRHEKLHAKRLFEQAIYSIDYHTLKTRNNDSKKGNSTKGNY